MLDENDTPPHFIPATQDIQVPEDAWLGYIVVTLTSQDDDLEGVVTYDLESGGEGKFEVEALNGKTTNCIIRFMRRGNI